MICSKCKIDKNDSEFAFRFISKGKKLSNCKQCQKQYARNHYLKNKEKVKKQVNYNKNKLKHKFYDYLQDKFCIRCGNSDIRVFEFDHRESSTKKETISKMVSECHSWINILKEIEKCDILCANCHKIRTSSQFNWGKNKFITQ